MEERECTQSFCLPECPSYRLIELKKQVNNHFRLDAQFFIERATYPIGKLESQRIRLETKDIFQNEKLVSTEFDLSKTRSEVYVRDLIRNVVYLPIYEFQLSLNSSITKKLTKLIWECKGQVKLIKRYRTFIQLINFTFYSPFLVKHMHVASMEMKKFLQQIFAMENTIVPMEKMKIQVSVKATSRLNLMAFLLSLHTSYLDV